MGKRTRHIRSVAVFRIIIFVLVQYIYWFRNNNTTTAAAVATSLAKVNTKPRSCVNHSFTSHVTRAYTVVVAQSPVKMTAIARFPSPHR